MSPPFLYTLIIVGSNDSQAATRSSACDKSDSRITLPFLDGTKILRYADANAPLLGMFWKLGSLDELLPVTVLCKKNDG